MLQLATSVPADLDEAEAARDARYEVAGSADITLRTLYCLVCALRRGGRQHLRWVRLDEATVNHFLLERRAPHVATAVPWCPCPWDSPLPVAGTVWL